MLLSLQRLASSAVNGLFAPLAHHPSGVCILTLLVSVLSVTFLIAVTKDLTRASHPVSGPEILMSLTDSGPRIPRLCCRCSLLVQCLHLPKGSVPSVRIERVGLKGR